MLAPSVPLVIYKHSQPTLVTDLITETYGSLPSLPSFPFSYQSFLGASPKYTTSSLSQGLILGEPKRKKALLKHLPWAHGHFSR